MKSKFLNNQTMVSISNEAVLFLCSAISLSESFVPSFHRTASFAVQSKQFRHFNNHFAPLSSTESEIVAEDPSSIEVAEAVSDESVAAAVPDDSATGTGEVTDVIADVVKIYLGNLPPDHLESNVRELLMSKAEGLELAEVKVPLDRFTGKSRGFAFVSVVASDGLTADSVLEMLDGLDVNGTLVTVAPQKSKDELASSNPFTKMYVGNLPFDTTEEDIVDFMQQLGGEVTDTYLPLDQGRLRGFAFVTMSKEDAAKCIEELDGTDFDGRTLTINESLPKGKSPPRRRAMGIKLYVGNISFQTEEDTLRQEFEEFGDVMDVYLPTDRDSGRPRGFGFVTIARDAHESAIEQLDGKDVDGRFWRVNVAQAKGRQQVDSWGEEE